MSFWDKKEAKILFRELPFYKILTDKHFIMNLVL